MKFFNKLRANMSVNIIGIFILFLVIFGTIVGVLGYISFSDAFEREYAISTYHMGYTATSFVNGNHIKAYLDGEYKEEYDNTKKIFDEYSRTMNLSLVYIIYVDQSDYGRFISVFNSVNNSVGNTSYTEWELGFKRDTTNDEYRRKYKAIFNKETLYETVYRTNPQKGTLPHITTIVPVKDSNDDVVALLCLQRPMRELDQAKSPYLITIILTTIILSIVSTVIVSLLLRGRFIKPIRKVSEEATRFAKENKKGEPLGKISVYSEITNLANSIDKMEADMVHYIDNLQVIMTERERIGAELSVARNIQANSVPNIFPAFPNRSDFDIYAFMKPAKEVGGDFYNFFLLDEDHLVIFIGDVSGKGIAASLFMMVTNILISDRIMMGGTPSEVFTFVNNNICDHNQAEMFVTSWLGILEISTGKLTCVNAGHEDPVVYRKGNSFELFKTKHDFIVGALKDMKFTDYEIQLNKGDKLFVYTDGVPEATDKEENMFTLNKMLDSLNETKEKSPKEILTNLNERINEFVGDGSQFDDITMLCIEIK